METTLSKTRLEELRALAAETLGYVSNQYILMTDLSRIFNIDFLHESFVNNVKDSIMHFKKLDDAYKIMKADTENVRIISNNNIEVLLQFELFAEHLTRAIIDTYVEILQYGSMFYHSFMKCVLISVNENRISNADTIISSLRSGMHNCKNEILTFREKKLNIFRFSNWENCQLDGRFVVQLVSIISRTKDDYKKIQDFLCIPEIKSIYNIVLQSLPLGYSLYCVKKHDTLDKLEDSHQINIKEVQKINNLDFRSKDKLPEGLWLMLN